MFQPPATANPTSTDVESLLLLQRRLVYEVSGDPESAAIVFCDHPRGITLGREASRLHVRYTEAELVAKRYPLHWVARGGGAMLHLPGQIACYPILPLQAWGISPAKYVRILAETLAEVAEHFGVKVELEDSSPALRVGTRRIGSIGAAVRQGVSLYGVVLNVDPDLEDFRRIDCDCDPHPMTSLQRESPHRLRLQSVQQRFLGALASRLGLRGESPVYQRPVIIIPMRRHAYSERY